MKPDPTTKLALATTRLIGSPVSILVHSILFILCFTAVWLNFVSLNEMLLALTTIVSLEAIYLALFIQLTVNYQARSIEEVSEDIDEIQEDVGEIQEDIDELQEDVEEMSEEETAEEHRKSEQKQTLATIQNDLRKLMQDIEKLQNRSQ